jgi:hypothetical protein
MSHTVSTEQGGVAANFRFMFGRWPFRISIWITAILSENFRNSTPVSRQDNTSIIPRFFFPNRTKLII